MVSRLFVDWVLVLCKFRFVFVIVRLFLIMSGVVGGV